MFLLSSGKSTVISEFHSLQTKDSYKHETNDTTDFKFLPQKLAYAELYKNSRVEFLRINPAMYSNTIKTQRITKVNDRDGVCIACSKRSHEKFAVGTKNGTIKLYNDMYSGIVYQYPTDPVKSGVSYLDFNSSDHYLSAVLASGHINIFGNHAKINTFWFAGLPWMARFHPFESSCLNIATKSGELIIYDILSMSTFKKYPYDYCSDFSMSPALPNVIISVGTMEGYVKIYDKRNSAHFQHINEPLSAVSLSRCGKYYCTGSSFGVLRTFDMRNSKNALAVKQVHDGRVARIRFFLS